MSTAARLAAAAAGLFVATAVAAPAQARAPRFDPPAHSDARDAAPLDLRRVAFGQRDLRMVLDVRTRRAWPTRALRGGSSLCVVLRGSGRVCVVAGARRGAVLRLTPDDGPPRAVPGAVLRRDARSLRAAFAPRAAGLRVGRVRWAVEARDDRFPDRGFRSTTVRVLGQPYCFGAAARDRTRPCRNASLRSVVFPRPAEAFLWDNSPCRRLRRHGVFQPCEFGVTDGSRTSSFALVGDSHAMHWRAALQVVAEARRWRGVSIARPGCPFSVRIPRSPALGPGQCARLHRETLAWLRARPEVETLFVSNWAPPGSAPIGGNPGYAGGAADFGAMLDGVPPTVRRIYVLRDIPGTTLGSVDCVRMRRHARRALAGACGARRSAVLIPDPGAAAARSRGPRVRALDFTRHLCGPARCFPVVGGAYVYKDLDHMNAVFAMSLGPYVLRALRGGPRARDTAPP
ncbi:MAG TPA: SGNH hydrolase domain-containing protein [Solirubrobacteraceae bacterium]